jgi:transcriptional regulator with XRE-family HTH domain
LAGLGAKSRPTKVLWKIHIVRHLVELCIIIHFVPSDSEALKAYMEERHLGQVELAREAGVSQSTVSRALSGAPLKHGRARSKLFTYAQLEDPNQQMPPKKGPQRVMTAFKRIWDGTEDHANAVAKIIDALEDLKPAKKKRG